MDKLEYIPGDFISVYVGVKKYIVEVIGTENENEVLSYQIKFPNGEIQYADKDNIVPIPLTPEILEKNGWKNDGYDWYKLPTKRAYLYITKDIITLGEFLVCVGLDRHNLASINFVHQLQHIFFSLNINHKMEV
ncbi:hypothetical protein [Segatella copri]|jgi:hypothetical protein|uniref:hypothetical protein n=1 Tax=Segatella copri TaxID=165179 RepID=UPI0018622D84|nr:hypothetical protein [Segatella copri]MBM0153750.1 hypothetical protein [Segatella copri]MBM0156113.1 hypothetical protein [Segatella copri]QNT65731.1 hypothetical protein FO447_03790 [Segatella copri]